VISRDRILALLKDERDDMELEDSPGVSWMNDDLAESS